MSPASSSPPTPPTPETDQLGFRIARLREIHGWKQRELARRAALSPDRLSRLERGISPASVVELARLSAAFGISCDELLFGPGKALPETWAAGLERLGNPADEAFVERLLHLLGLGLRAEAAGPAAPPPAVEMPGRPRRQP